jgi:hypothetical protein
LVDYCIEVRAKLRGIDPRCARSCLRNEAVSKPLVPRGFVPDAGEQKA